MHGQDSERLGRPSSGFAGHDEQYGMRQTRDEQTIESAETEIDEVLTPGFGESDRSVTSRSGCDLFSPGEVFEDPFSIAYGNYNAVSSNRSLDMLSFDDELQAATGDNSYLDNALGLIADGYPRNPGWGLSELPFHNHDQGTALAGGASNQDQGQFGGDLRMTVVINEARQETLVEVMKVLVDAQARVEFRCG